MKNILIADMTLSSTGHDTQTLSFKEKLEIARSLDRLCVDVIELPPIQEPRTDALLVRTMASFVKTAALSMPVGFTAESLQEAWAAVKGAKRRRLRADVPVSPVQMEYFCKKKPAAVMKLIAEQISAARALCDDVEFRAQDAVRAEPAFLREAVRAAIGAGASTVTVCDSEGTMFPAEFADFVKALIESVPELSGVSLGVECASGVDMATASAFSAVLAGASEIKASACGEDCPGIAALAGIVKLRGDSCGVTCGINRMEVQRITGRIDWLTHTARAATSPFDNGASAGEGAPKIDLTGSHDISELRRAVRELGYDLSEDDIVRVYEAFSQVADKKNVGARELDAIIASVSMQVPAAYRLVSYVFTSGNLISATAHIKLERDGKEVQGIAIGDGPVDASFLAIEQTVGRHFELDDFQIQAVTEGREALGSTLVKLRSGGKLYSGNGISTDVIGASIKAYLNAVNKIVYEQEG